MIVKDALSVGLLLPNTQTTTNLCSLMNQNHNTVKRLES